MQSYSRGALLALGVGLVFWFSVTPLRLRGAIVLLGASAGAIPVIAWSFTMTGLTTDDLPLPVRSDSGHELGAFLLLMLVLVFALGLVAGFLAAERPASPEAKRLAGRVLLGLLALLPVIVLIGLASAPGGVDGQVSKAWNQLTNPNVTTPPNSPGRFTATSSVRARYWDEAIKVHGVSPVLGTGAGAYATVRNRFRTDRLFVRHAHGYVPQTLADLGWVGLGLSLLARGPVGQGRGAGDRAAAPRPRAAVGCRAGRDGHAGRDRARLRRALRGGLDVVRARERADRPRRRRVGRGAPVAADAHAGGRAGHGGARGRAQPPARRGAAVGAPRARAGPARGRRRRPGGAAGRRRRVAPPARRSRGCRSASRR